jgi:hypothetical protein
MVEGTESCVQLVGVTGFVMPKVYHNSEQSHNNSATTAMKRAVPHKEHPVAVHA